MSVFINGTSCDIYIGKGAGAMLLKDISNAKNSIKIVSPYLSPSLITELIELNKKGIKIKLITTDKLEDFKDKKNIYNLIIQNRETDYSATTQKEKWKDYIKVIKYISIGVIASLIGVFFYTKNPVVLFGTFLLISLFFVYKLYKTKIKKIKIYTYWYSQLFPFKVYITRYKSNLTDEDIHSKIYLIDNKIAYLGSLNFTKSGTEKNYETRIRTTDTKTIYRISQEIDDLFYNSSMPEKDIQLWGKELYSEPIN